MKIIGSNSDDRIVLPDLGADGVTRYNGYGRDGDDVLVDGAGLNLLFGGSGRDTFVFRLDGERDYVKDFNPDEDVIDLSGLGVRDYSQVLASQAGVTNHSVFIFDNESIYISRVLWREMSESNFIFAAPDEPLPASITMSETGSWYALPAGAPMDLIANDRGNRLSGNDDANRIEGLAGNDVILAQGGDDVLVDGAGRDSMRGGFGRDTFVLVADGDQDFINDFEPGTDRIDVSDWGVTAFEQLEITYQEQQGRSQQIRDAEVRFGGEVLTVWKATRFLQDLTAEDFGFTESVTLTGGDANDKLRGGGGDDVLTDGGGKDNLFGGFGADTFVLVADGVADNIKDFGAGDRIDISAWGVTGFDQLTITEHRTGKAIIRYEDEGLAVTIPGANAVEVLDVSDFIFA